MHKKELLKNRLDIEYNFESRKALVFLTLGTITLAGFISYMIAQEKRISAFAIGIVIFILALFLYIMTKNKMNKLLEKIENL